MKYISSAGWYSISIPDGWVVEEGNNIISFSEPVEGVGSLQISAYEIPSRSNFDLVDEFLDSLSDTVSHISKDEISSGIRKEDNMVNFEVTTPENRYFSYWMIYKNNKLLFITYNCMTEDSHKEKEVVDKIVNSIDWILA